VHLTVLAPGELVAAQPAVLRAPMDGVVEQIHVQPNEMVKQGQLLFNLDEAQLASRLEVSEQALQTAEAEYRQFAQLALGDVRSNPSRRRWPARLASAAPSRRFDRAAPARPGAGAARWHGVVRCPVGMDRQAGADR
jgi:multidrug efflux pump subunit AcrA (membrane-fusion protein)